MPLFPETPPDHAEREIFAAAAALPTEDRATYLDSICEARPELRARIEVLLSQQESADFMQTITGGNRGNPEESGDCIGAYKLLEQIGEGGFGTVWMAEQERPVRRRVALKIIKLGMDTREVIARFEQERQALAMMDHPNIASVFDAGATDNGRPFFVMELVKGMPITQYCDGAGLGTRERLALFADVCAAINHAHQKGIIHRDIKPSNVMVTLHGDKAVVKVIDFGIAKATQGKLTDKTLYTRLEQFIGTPVYMSPEQAGLLGLDVDTRSDIYALGILLYELLTGKPPFDAKTLASAGYEEMRRIIREVEPPKPSSRLGTVAGEERLTLAKARQIGPAKLSRMVEPDLDWIVMKAIEKDRTRRYETANGFAQDIGRFLAGETVSASPPGAGYRLRKFVKRHKFAFAASSAVLAALILGLGLSLWQSIEKTRALWQAMASERKSSEVAGFLKEMLNGVGPSVALGRDTALLKEILDKTAERIGTELREQPEVEYELRNTVGEVYRVLGENTEAKAMHQRALEMGLALYGENDARVAMTKNNLGLVLNEEGDFIGAEKQFLQAVDTYRKLGKAPSDDLAATLNNLSMVYRNTSMLERAEAVQRESLAMITELHGDGYVKAGYCEVNLSIILQRAGNQPDAESFARSAVAIFRKAEGRDNPETAMALGNLALVLKNGGKFPEAEQAARDALTMRRQVLDPSHPEIARNLTELASILSPQGKLEEAEARCREALDILHTRFGEEHRFIAFVLDELGHTQEALERFDEAAANYGDALVMRRDLLDPAHPDIVRSLKSLSLLRYKQGRLEDSESLMREALQISLGAVGPSHRYLIAIYRHLGLVAEDRKRVGEAVTLYRSAMECQRKDPNADPATTIDLLECLGRTLAADQKYDESEKCYQEALATCEGQSGIPPGIPGNIRSQLGGVLLAAGIRSADGSDADRLLRFTAAEQHLTSGLEIMQRGLETPPAYLRDAFERLIRLYTAWNEFFPDPALPLKATGFKQKLSDLDAHPPNSK